MSSDDSCKEAAGSTNRGGGGDGDEQQTFEINVKTLENDVHKVRVVKNMSVAELKEKIVDITGVSVEAQRLIFRGRVLNDDQSLSEYHVEEGHTLHMVARRPNDGQNTPGSTSADGNRNNTGNDSSANGQRNRPGQVPRNVIFGVNITETGEEMTDQIVRGISDMLRSLSSNLMSPGGGGVGNNQASANGGGGAEQEGLQNANNRGQSVNPVQPGFAVLNHQIQVSPMPPAALLPRNMVIPDAVTTLSDFIHRMEVALQSSAASGETPSQRPEALPLNQRGVPTPQALASVITQARQLLTGSFASSLSQFVQHLERDAGSTDGSARQAIQSEAIQTGVLMQHLGAMLLELGRTTMTLRMGSSPEESVVNSGPSVYLNANGPNPIMVQPFPLQTSSLLGGGQIIGGVVGPFTSTIGTTVPPSNSTASETPVDPNAVPTHPSGDPQPIRSLAPGGGIVRQPVGPGGHLLSVVYPVQVRAPTSSGALPMGQLRTPSAPPQSNQNAQSAFQSVGPGGISSLVQQINAQLSNVLSGLQPGQGNVSGQGNISANMTGGEGNVGGTAGDNSPLSASEQVPVSGNIRTRSLSRQDASLVRSGSDNKVGEHSTDTKDSVNNTSASTSSDTMQSPKYSQGSDISTPAPLGLGLAGLQPKKKMKASKSMRDGPSQPPAMENQTTPQLDFQSLLSQISSMPNSNQMQSTAPQPQRADLGSMFSQLLQSPAINNLMTNMASQSGMGSPGELRHVMEQCTQDPTMQNIFGDLVQQIDRQRVMGQSGQNNNNAAAAGGGGGGGGIDLSRIVQQMMPVVSSMLGGGGAGQPMGGSSPSVPANSPSVQTGGAREASLQQARERIERRDSASNIFTSVMESTGLHRTADGDFANLINALSTNSDLANEYMNVLHEEVRKRVQSDSGKGNRE